MRGDGKQNNSLSKHHKMSQMVKFKSPNVKKFHSLIFIY